MPNNNPSRWRVLWLLPPIAIGALVLLWSVGGKKAPIRIEAQETGRAVRIITAPKLTLVPKALGYGTVQPERVWAAVAEVAGRIVEVHPRLHNGEIIPAETLLFRIDPVDYELALAKATAEIAELDVQEKNAQGSLEIEQRNLAVARRELKRLRELTQQGTASRADADSAERAMLTSRSAVQNMENTLALLPAQRAVLQAQLAQAERNLEHTSISAPFNLRIANLQIEKDQYVTVGQRLFDGDAVDRVEIVAQVSLASLRNIFLGRQLQLGNITGLNAGLADLLSVTPTLRMDMGSYTAEWEATFVRFSDAVDSATRTIGVVVAVDKPFEKAVPGYRPPLSKGMFVQVELKGEPQPDRLVVPRAAIRGGNIYIVDEEDRLRIQPVEVLFSQGRLSVVNSGLEPGQRIVVSDVIPAVLGMLLQPQPDDRMSAELRAAAGSD